MILEVGVLNGWVAMDLRFSIGHGGAGASRWGGGQLQASEGAVPQSWGVCTGVQRVDCKVGGDSNASGQLESIRDAPDRPRSLVAQLYATTNLRPCVNSCCIRHPPVCFLSIPCPKPLLVPAHTPSAVTVLPFGCWLGGNGPRCNRFATYCGLLKANPPSRPPQVIPRERRTQLFSATMTNKVAKLQRACLVKPVKVEVAHKYSTVDTLRQQYLFVPAKYKDCYLAFVLNELSGSTFMVGWGRRRGKGGDG